MRLLRRSARPGTRALAFVRQAFGLAPPTPDRGVRWLFLRGLGTTYFMAFASLRRQVKGLYGERGIAPVKDYLEAIRGDLETGTGAPPSTARILSTVPTALWFDPSDRGLERLCDAGMVCSTLLSLNVAPKLTAALCQAAWLSFVSVGQGFLSYQWDALLLEAGTQGVLLAPPGIRPGFGRHEAALASRLALRLLVFRLYFESGLAKLRSGDRTWRERTANRYYYETAPLPTPLGWQAHHLPPQLQDLSTRLALILECGVPFFAFGPRLLRRAAFGALTGLQVAIAATGNYAFFNWLSAVLGLGLLDDSALPRRLTRKAPPLAPPSWWRTALSTLAVAPILALQLGDLVMRLGRLPPKPLRRLAERLAPLMPVSSYGLFAVMTVERPEISIEGSSDGVTWEPYTLPYKPDAPDRPLKFVAPHQPRLDWQLWFAALGHRPQLWFLRLAERLLEGSPDVRALFVHAPFEEKPPRYLRAVRYDYRMTDRRTRKATGALWRREKSGLFMPPVSLQPN